MRAQDFVTESVDIRQAIMQAVKQQGGRPDEYFVRYTDQDKLGYSSRQHFGRTPDVGDADYDPDSLPRPRGRPALWFYPLKTFLNNQDIYASEQPYVWLVRLRPNAWLQDVDHKTQQQQPAPVGKQRVGMLTSTSGLPTAVFFRPGFEVVDRWYDYGKMHKRRKQ